MHCLRFLALGVLVCAVLTGCRKEDPAPPASGSGSTATPSATPSAEAAELLKKVAARYQTLQSYSSTGEVISDIDMSAAQEALPVPQPSDPKQAAELQQALSKPQKTQHTFSILLARPSLYRVDWEQEMRPGFTQKGSAWSSGEGDFVVLSARGQEPMKQPSRMMALAMATGVSGGAANTIPSLFFAESQVPTLSALEGAAFEKEESIDGQACHVISGTLTNQKMIYWISKEGLLVLQRRHVLGGTMAIPEFTDEQATEALKAQKQEPTPERIAQLKAQMKQFAAISSKLKGSITEMHHDIKVNQPVEKEQFEPK